MKLLTMTGSAAFCYLIPAGLSQHCADSVSVFLSEGVPSGLPQCVFLSDGVQPRSTCSLQFPHSVFFSEGV